MDTEAPTDPLADLALDRLSRGLALGTQRGELETLAQGRSPLLLLSLLGQRLRFGRTASARIPGTGRALPTSQTPVAPDVVRSALIRMVVGREDVADLTGAAFGAIRDAGFRLHPFDLARLAPYLRGREEVLGPVERAFLAFHQKHSEPELEAGDDTPITAENWLSASKAERLRFIQSIRLRDPAEARAMIEAAIAGAKAPLRAELVGVLRLRSSIDDRPFLESLNGDRAQQVRELVAGLLARIPGTGEFDTRLAEAAGMLSLGRSGLLKTHKILKVTPPKVPENQLDAILQQRFQGMSLRALLGKLGVDPADLGSLTKGVDRVTALSLLWAASADGDLEQMAELVRSAQLAQPNALLLLAAELMVVPPEARRKLVEHFLDLRSLVADGDSGDLIRLRRLLGGPVSPRFISALVGPAWGEVVKAIEASPSPNASAILVAAFTALASPDAAAAHRKNLEVLDPAIADPSLRYADVLIALTSARP